MSDEGPADDERLVPGKHPGEYWRSLIEESGRTQVDVARALNVSTKHLNRVLQGHALPSATLTIMFAAYIKGNAGVLWHLQADYELDLARMEWMRLKPQEEE